MNISANITRSSEGNKVKHAAIESDANIKKCHIIIETRSEIRINMSNMSMLRAWKHNKESATYGHRKSARHFYHTTRN